MILIQPPTPNDFNAMGGINSRVAFPREKDPPFYKRPLRDVIELQESRKMMCAKQYENVYGFISYQIKNKAGLWINELCVDKDYQRKGIGTMLLHQAETFAENRSCLLVVAEIERKNKKAIHFFMDNGYIQVNHRLSESPYHYISGRNSILNKPLLAKPIVRNDQ